MPRAKQTEGTIEFRRTLKHRHKGPMPMASLPQLSIAPMWGECFVSAPFDWSVKGLRRESSLAYLWPAVSLYVFDARLFLELLYHAHWVCTLFSYLLVAFLFCRRPSHSLLVFFSRSLHSLHTLLSIVYFLPSKVNEIIAFIVAYFISDSIHDAFRIDCTPCLERRCAAGCSDCRLKFSFVIYIRC